MKRVVFGVQRQINLNLRYLFSHIINDFRLIQRPYSTHPMYIIPCERTERRTLVRLSEMVACTSGDNMP